MSFKHLLSINNFIFENYQYVDFNEIDLQKDFDYLNKKLFDNKLNNIPLKFNKSKIKLGIVSINTETLVNRLTKKKTVVKEIINYLAISTFFELSHKQYIDVLAHEMIHVYLIQRNVIEDDHGTEFKKEMNRINNTYGFNIKISEDAKFYNVKSDDSIKTYGVVIMHIKDKIDMVVTTPKQLESENIEAFVNFIKKYKYQLGSGEITIDFYLCNNKELSKFKIKTKLISSMGLYPLEKNSELLISILNSNKLKSVII